MAVYMAITLFRMGFFLSFFLFWRLSIITKCDFIKTVTHNYKYIQRLEKETAKTCDACSIVNWEGTCARQ